MRNTSAYSRRVGFARERRRRGLVQPSCTRAALQENPPHTTTPSCNAHRWKERLRSICDARRRKAKKQRPNAFERWSYQKIASLLASQRRLLFETRSNILLVFTVLCISRGSFLFFHPPSLRFLLAFCVTKTGSVSTDRLLSLMNERGRNGHHHRSGSVSFWVGEVCGMVRERDVMIGESSSSELSCFYKGGLSICFLGLSRSIDRFNSRVRHLSRKERERVGLDKKLFRCY